MVKRVRKNVDECIVGIIMNCCSTIENSNSGNQILNSDQR